MKNISSLIDAIDNITIEASRRVNERADHARTRKHVEEHIGTIGAHKTRTIDSELASEKAAQAAKKYFEEIETLAEILGYLEYGNDFLVNLNLKKGHKNNVAFLRGCHLQDRPAKDERVPRALNYSASPRLVYRKFCPTN